jgi:hypothetical protein
MQRSPHSSLRPKKSRGAAVRAMFAQQSDAALAIAKRNQIFAEQTNADRRTIGLRISQTARQEASNAASVCQRLFRTDLRE